MRHPRSGLTRRIPSPGPPGANARRPPGRLRPRLLASLLLALVLPAACGGSPEDASADPHRELRQRLDIDDGREIHRIALGGRGGEEHVAPTLLRLGSREIVEFVTVDGRIHTVSFPEDSLALDAALFLRRTSQLESPPLVERGARFVLAFEGAPAGRYPFRSEGPGGEAWGVIVVGDAQEASPER